MVSKLVISIDNLILKLTLLTYIYHRQVEWPVIWSS